MTRTWFIDIDGTILKHRSNAELDETVFLGYAGTDKDNEELLPGVKEFFGTIHHEYVILTTARHKEHSVVTEPALERFGIQYDLILYDIGSRERVLINDIKPLDSHDNPTGEVMQTAYAINVDRNGGLDHLINRDGLC